MNRLFQKRTLLTVASAALLAALAITPAHAKDKKKKKNQDLSSNPLADVNTRQPDKELYDKAMIALKKGRFDVARLDLQTLLNTYPSSEYQMRAKLSVGDTWFKEGGTAALTQAESEYKDFITFFPTAPEAAEAQMKVADIYYMQMEKPDRDYTNVMKAEQEYRMMINQFPDSTLIPRAKQKLRAVQEVEATREASIGNYYLSRENWSAAIARLQTVADTYPLYSNSDMVWLAIGDSYAGTAHTVEANNMIPPAMKERLKSVYLDKATAAYGHVITRYPMAPHVEDARDRLVAMNRPIPEPTKEAVAESEAEESSRQPLRFTDKTLGLIKHGPTTVEAAHVGEPTMEDPKRIYAPDVNKQNTQIFTAAYRAVHPEAAAAANATATGANEPPRSDQPSTAPLATGTGDGGTSVGVEVLSTGENKPADGTGTTAAPATADPNAVVKAVGPTNTELPPVEKPAAAPDQVNDIKPGQTSNQAVSQANSKKKVKAPKADLSDESSSKKKKKKGLNKINPF